MTLFLAAQEASAATAATDLTIVDQIWNWFASLVYYEWMLLIVGIIASVMTLYKIFGEAVIEIFILMGEMIGSMTD